MKLLTAMTAGALFSAAFASSQYGVWFALVAAFGIFVYHCL